MNNAIGWQVVLDCYNCDKSIVNDITEIKSMIYDLCKQINASVVKENYHMFEPYGISAYAIITTSHISIHTWPEFNFVAIDIFSCKNEVANCFEEYVKKKLNTNDIEITYLTRGVRI